MEMLTLADAKKKQDELLKDGISAQREICDELLRLVSSPGYSYAKSVAKELLRPYACEPPKSKEEEQKWQTFNTLSWAFEKFFSTLEQTAQAKPPSHDELKAERKNADSRRKPDSTSTSTGRTSKRG